MNAETEVHADDLKAQQLDEIYGDQAGRVVEREGQGDGEPVSDDEQLDRDLVDKQHANPSSAQGEAGRD